MPNTFGDGEGIILLAEAAIMPMSAPILTTFATKEDK